MNQSYSKRLDEWIMATSGCNLLDYCRKFNYSAKAQKLMGLDENNKAKSQAIIRRDPELKQLYLDSEQSTPAKKRRGSRSWTQYYKDLISGWVLEDLTIEMFRNQGLDVSLNGIDNHRDIRVFEISSQEPDLIIKVGNNERKVELTNEINDILETRGYVEKRSPALIELWNGKAIWIYRTLSSGKYVLVDFATESITLHHRFHQDWGKEVHRYVLSENGKKMRDDRMLTAELISVAGCGIADKEQPQLTVIEDDGNIPEVNKEEKKETEKVPEPNPLPMQDEKEENIDSHENAAPVLAEDEDESDGEAYSSTELILGDEDFV